MSIEKEVEKMYREDAEKQKKNQKKKKNGRMATIIVLILILILALLLAKVLGLFGGSGFGFGGGGKDEGSGDGSPERSVTVSAEEESTASEAEKVFDNVKVSGSTYLYKGSEISLEDLVDTFSMEKMNKDVVALIEDDNATQDTMEELTKALDEMGREYVIEDAASAENAEESAAEPAVG
ncbi:hypothetical protein [Ruminococcus sp.]|uniref:hypothetical protein n=1 Tax=Ruminococcus sp. TaxID=41978 RepID=UPI0025DF07FB|nr:hypothetical protein [Ruminococcus sp.]MBQ8966981.1 hypothetical protein [Ruminococcus sp.]